MGLRHSAPVQRAKRVLAENWLLRTFVVPVWFMATVILLLGLRFEDVTPFGAVQLAGLYLVCSAGFALVAYLVS